MPEQYLHDHKEFEALLRILEEETGIVASLIEKDYWIMHVIFGLKQLGLKFELKGGTSLSKGYGLIHRFSEDIDIHIKAPEYLKVDDDPQNNTNVNVSARKEFYDWLVANIKIDGIISIERDYAFDDVGKYRSGGIRLKYKAYGEEMSGIKEGILLEAGFDTIIPNRAMIISSWAYEKAIGISGIEIFDNRGIDVLCYHPGYTFVEKLQTIATKFRQEQQDGNERPNYMRQYYDVYCLLESPEVIQFIGSSEYLAHKKARFPAKDFEIPIALNEAFLLYDKELRTRFRERYETTKTLYYKGQPHFNEVLERIVGYVDKL